MAHGIEGAGFNPASIAPLTGRQGAEQVEGNYHGQKVVTVDHSSLVQDSLEELPAHQSENVSKKLAQRTASTGSGSRIRELLEKYLKTVKGAPEAEKFQEAAEALRKLKNGTPDQIKERLREFLGSREGESLDGGDAASLLALEELFGAEPGGEAVLAAIREVKAEYGAELQKFAQEHLKTFEGMSEVYKQLVGEHGEGDFLESSEMLIKKLGGDIQAQARTMDPNALKARLDSLYHLEVARNTYNGFAQLLDKVDRLQSAS